MGFKELHPISDLLREGKVADVKFRPAREVKMSHSRRRGKKVGRG
jgi:hypothetical protein